MVKAKNIALVNGYEKNDSEFDGVSNYFNELFRSLITNSNELLKFKWEAITQTGILYWFKRLYFLFKNYDLIHFQYPYESWKNSILPGVLIPLFSLLYYKKNTVITLHEWSQMHFLRRLSIFPMVFFLKNIIFVSKKEMNAFSESFLIRYRKNKYNLSCIPFGITVNIPKTSKELIQREREFLKENHFDFVIGYFGFIYDAKQPLEMIETLYFLKKNHNINPKMVFCGDFLNDNGYTQKKISSKIEDLNLKKNISFLGKISDEKKLALILKACDCILLLYSDGITSRRGSFWYSLELNIPIITTKPFSNDEFKDLLDFNFLINKDKLFLVDPVVNYDVITKAMVNIYNNGYKIITEQSFLSPKWNDTARIHFEYYFLIL